MMTTHKLCGTKSDIPKKDHYAILEFSHIDVPGDERSRTHPGHGYPASREEIVRYHSYIDVTEWEAEIKRREIERDSKYMAIVVKVPRISVATTIIID